MDLHFQQCHPITTARNDVLDGEGDPLTKTIAPASGKSSQPHWLFHSVADFNPNGSDAIQTSLQGPSLDHADYNDFFVNKQHSYLLVHNAQSRDSFRAEQSPPSRFIVDDFPSINELHTYASSAIGGNQLNPQAPLSFLPIEAVSTTASFAPTSSFSPPTPLPQPPFPTSRHVCAAARPSAGQQKCSGTQQYMIKGFLRRDKLIYHWQNRHGRMHGKIIDIQKEAWKVREGGISGCYFMEMGR